MEASKDPSEMPHWRVEFEDVHYNFHAMKEYAQELDMELLEASESGEFDAEELIDECNSVALRLERDIVEYLDAEVYFEAAEMFIGKIAEEDDKVHGFALNGYIPFKGKFDNFYKQQGTLVGISYVNEIPKYIGGSVDDIRPAFCYLVEVNTITSDKEKLDKVVRHKRILLPVRSTNLYLADKSLQPDITLFEENDSIIRVMDEIIDDPWTDIEDKLRDLDEQLTANLAFLSPEKRAAYLAYLNYSDLLPKEMVVNPSRLWMTSPDGYLLDTRGRVFEGDELYFDWIHIPVADSEIEETGSTFEEIEKDDTIATTRTLGLSATYGGGVKFIMSLNQDMEII